MLSKNILLIILILCVSGFLMFWELDNVDLEASEIIYLSDSVNYIRDDPFTVPRHHLRKAHAPASPHPFFVQLLTAEVFKYLGTSVYTARLLQTGSIVLSTAIIMLIAWSMFRCIDVAIGSALVFTTIPLVVRFGRMAVLDPVLALIQVIGILFAWMYLSSKGVKRYIFALLLGVALGLSISTKLTGIFFVLPIGLMFIWNFYQHRDKQVLWSLTVFLISTSLVFILLNDPYSYIYGWTHFSDPKHTRIGLLAIAKGLIAFKYWSIFFYSMIPLLTILLLIAIVKYWPWWKGKRRLFLLIWLSAPFSYLILNPLHITGLSAEWSYVPLIPPLSIISAATLLNVWKKIAPRKLRKHVLVLFVGYILLSIPFVLFYGLRFKEHPLASYYKARNVIRGDLAVTSLINQLNQIDEDITILLEVKGSGFPVWLLKDNIFTEPFYHSIDYYDYVVTDNDILSTKALENNFCLIKDYKNPSEPGIDLLHICK